MTHTDLQPLSFSQQRLWLMDQLEPGTIAYNQHYALRIEGRVCIETLRRSLHALVERHESLRTTFRTVDGEPAQVIQPLPDIQLPFASVEHLPETQRMSEAFSIAAADTREPFDLQKGPLFRFKLIRLSQALHLLSIATHHIVSDGWSEVIMLRELGEFYDAL